MALVTPTCCTAVKQIKRDNVYKSSLQTIKCIAHMSLLSWTQMSSLLQRPGPVYIVPEVSSNGHRLEPPAGPTQTNWIRISGLHVNIFLNTLQGTLMSNQDYSIFPPKFHTKSCQIALIASGWPLAIKRKEKKMPLTRSWLFQCCC